MYMLDPCVVRGADHSKLRRAYYITCGRCGYGHKQAHNFDKTEHGVDDNITMRRVHDKLEAQGWEMGKRPIDARCPDCVKELKSARIVAMAEKQFKQRSSSMVSPVPLKGKAKSESTAAPSNENTKTPELGRQDRRVIFSKLESVYGSEDTGYTYDWTDAKVAADLGTKLEWVQQVREENFGPATDPAHQMLLAEARAWRERTIQFENSLATFKLECQRLYERGE